MHLLRAATSLSIALCIALLAAPEASAQAEEGAGEAPATVKVVIVVGKGKGAPVVKGPVKKLIEKSLKETVEVIDFKTFNKAARKAKVKKKDLTSAQTAKDVGAVVEATHVLIIESAMQLEEVEGKKRKQKIFFAEVSVVEVASGDVVHTQPYALEGRKLTSTVADAILGDVNTKLVAAPAEEAAPEEVPAEEPVAETPPPPPEAPEAPEVPVAPEGEGDGADDGTAVAVADAADVPAGDTTTTEGQDDADPLALGGMIDDGGEPPPVDDAGTDSDPALGGELTAFAEEPEPSVTTRAAPTSDKNPRWRPALRLSVGALGLQRDGTMKSDDEGVEPPCYCGEEGESNPFFPAVHIGLEFYPGSLAAVSGKGELWEGIGLHLETFLTQVKTVVDPATDDSVDSSVFGINGGLSYRFVFWDAETAPDVKVKLGGSYFHFPLRVGVFPGVKYTGKGYAGLAFDIPLGVPMASLLLGGQYTLSVGAGGKTARLGEQDGGSAIRAEGGVRLSLAPVEVRLLFRWEQIETRYTGETTLGAAAEFNDVTLNDRFLGALVTAGVAF